MISGADGWASAPACLASDEVVRLKAELGRVRLALIEAQNPGIDMGEVRNPRPKPKLPDPILREE